MLTLAYDGGCNLYGNSQVNREDREPKSPFSRFADEARRFANQNGLIFSRSFLRSDDGWKGSLRHQTGNEAVAHSARNLGDTQVDRPTTDPRERPSRIKLAPFAGWRQSLLYPALLMRTPATQKTRPNGYRSRAPTPRALMPRKQIVWPTSSLTRPRGERRNPCSRTLSHTPTWPPSAPCLTTPRSPAPSFPRRMGRRHQWY